MRRSKVALVLGSGGARGLAHIGVLKVLEREKIPIDMIVGTSMGALVGGIYAAGIKPRFLEEIALNISWPQTAKFFTPTISKIGLVNGDKISNLIESFVGDIKIRETEIPFAAIATNIKTGREVIITDWKLSSAMQASASIPGIFTPSLYDNQLLVDGELVDPVPVRVARKMGADFVIAVNVIPRYDKIQSAEKISRKSGKGVVDRIINSKIINARISAFLNEKIKNTKIPSKVEDIFQKARRIREKVAEPNIFSVIMQTISIMECEIASFSARNADVVIEVGGLEDVNPLQFYKAAECISAGAKTTEDALTNARTVIRKLHL